MEQKRNRGNRHLASTKISHQLHN